MSRELGDPLAGLRWAVLKATLPSLSHFIYASEASIPGSCHPSVRLHSKTHWLPSEGLQGIPMPGQGLFLMGLRNHVSVGNVGGVLQKGFDQVLVGASFQLLDDLGLCLG